MLKINSNKFNFNFFLSDSKRVKSLNEGAKQFGGATKFNDAIYSNIEGTEYITISDNNKLSVFIPNTIDISSKIDNTYYIMETKKMIQNLYNNTDITILI